MYYEYWGLKKYAFHNVPDPSMYFDMHESVQSAVSEVLFAIEEGDECLAVIVGEVGLGKTMSLRMILHHLDETKHDAVLITNPDLTFPQLLREIIGQLQGEQCTTKSKDKLLETFHQILVAANRKNKKIVVLTDEANAIRRTNLESMRLLTNLQADNHNLFTLVLAGQPQLAEELEQPEMANLFQRLGIYAKLSKLGSREILQDYIEHRLERAGCARRVFTDEAIEQIWQHSEEGTPRLVNRLCKLALKAGETNQLDVIDAEVIEAVASRFNRTGMKRLQNRQAETAQEAPAEAPPASRNQDAGRDAAESEPAQQPAAAADATPEAAEPEKAVDENREAAGSESDAKARPDVQERPSPGLSEAANEKDNSHKEAKQPKDRPKPQVEAKEDMRGGLRFEYAVELAQPALMPQPSPDTRQASRDSSKSNTTAPAKSPAANRPSVPGPKTGSEAANRPSVPDKKTSPAAATLKTAEKQTPAKPQEPAPMPREGRPEQAAPARMAAQETAAEPGREQELLRFIEEIFLGSQDKQSQHESRPARAESRSERSSWQGPGTAAAKPPDPRGTLDSEPFRVPDPSLPAILDSSEEEARLEEEHNREIIVSMRERFRQPRQIGY